MFLPVPALLLTSCGGEPARRAAQSQDRAGSCARPRPYPPQDWPASYEATGTVRARTTATISSKVMGYVQQVNVQVGDHVRARAGA